MLLKILVKLIILDSSCSFLERFKLIIDCYTNKDIPDIDRQLPIWMLWRIWKSRNLLVYQHKSSTWREDFIKTVNDATEWALVWTIDSTTNIQTRQVQSRTHHSAWTRPKEDFVKCNFDCKFSKNNNVSQAGWIIRDSNGVFQAVGRSTGQHCSMSMEAELQALVMAMQHVWSKGYKKVIFEGDNLRLSSFLRKIKPTSKFTTGSEKIIIGKKGLAMLNSIGQEEKTTK
ncbi:unnamed protein product [Arabidopsis thaliana]|uniref:RNase H type-1 domain-containing protein n=1 Tax=Arabidopsis thaliana TaxID=3702 RepID=A0A5S9XHG5_ARATH|nr:unnamed protein product [Arabidopsis thaliana]